MTYNSYALKNTCNSVSGAWAGSVDLPWASSGSFPLFNVSEYINNVLAPAK